MLQLKVTYHHCAHCALNSWKIASSVFEKILKNEKKEFFSLTFLQERNYQKEMGGFDQNNF